ncbi:uncharacterized protein LOC129580473 [Sitodiplosis mosellana]|uniref:uncharacterized protein LOC129580473 n=1 Tax=Sitodiplosis mosellana TaxID=263140 RepID=UPI0024440D34|nr:uncharacterized protein LOC129580473 [Sitodiplosis mosellana]
MDRAVTEQIISFKNHLGSDCRGVENLLLVDADTLAFKSGQFLYFFIISAKVLSSTKCTEQSIGAITKNVTNNHLAIAENGCESKIYIRNYPSMEIVSVCSSGRSELEILSYSSSGKLLASQSNVPEFEVTIWDWQTATMLLQFRSTQINDNFDLKFSMDNDRFMYTGGAKHLHFWDIVQTFTGLKLIGNFGRFGKFKTCDILTVCTDKNNRLLTNCDWGNVLVWQNGQIKFEMCRKNRQPCHNATITQIILCNEYLYTIGKDNYVRIWFWDDVTLIDKRENEKIIEFEAVYEYEINSSIRSSDDLLSFTIDPDNAQFCYIHDGNGVIWKSIIDSDFTSHTLEAIFRASSRDLVSAAVSPNSTQFITLDGRGVLCLYNYKSGEMVFQYRFRVIASSLVWCSKEVNASGKTVIFGFVDGSIRVTCFDIDENTWNSSSIKTIQHSKPHLGRVKQILMNERVVVSASEDQTIFIYSISSSSNEITLSPIGFVRMNTVIQRIACFDCDVDKIMFATDFSSLQMLSFSIMDENYLWILLSDGNLYEYNFCTNIFSVIKDSGRINYYVIFDNGIVFFCLTSGKISVERFNYGEAILFTDIFTLEMPRDFELESVHMLFTTDKMNLIVYNNSSGSILRYNLKLRSQNAENSNVYERCTVEHQLVDESAITNCLSLEQQKQLELENNRKIQVQKRKAEVLEIIAKLKNEFAAVKIKHAKLPSKFHLNATAFEIDRRITDDLKWRTQQKFKTIQAELLKKIEKIRTQADRMQQIYLDNLEHWPITITGFRSRKIVETFLIYEINDEFQALKVQFDEREITLEISNSSEQKHSSDSVRMTDKSSDSVTHVNDFISSIAEKIYTEQVDIQTRRLFKRYAARKQEDLERRRQWKRIELAEPRFSFSTSSDENLHSDNWDTAADFEAYANQTIVDKYRMLKSIKLQITKIKRDFNESVLKLQDEKLKNSSILCDKISELDRIYKKLHHKRHDNTIAVKEHTEKVTQFDGKSFKEVHINVKDLQTKLQLFDESNEIDGMDIWTAELNKQQTLLFTQIESIYQNFDSKIDDIAEQSIEISLKVQFMELYYFVLYQELLVLNKFEEPHKSLLKSIDATNDKMKLLEEEVKLTKSKFKEQMGDDALVDTNGKIIEMELLFKANDSSIADQQLQILEQIAALPMSSAEKQTIKPLVDTIDSLLREWIILDRDLKGDKYALKKMLEEREAQMNDIDVVIMLPEDRFRTLKPSETTTFTESVLVNKNNMAKINEQINEYEMETLSEHAKQKSLQLQLNQIKSTCTKINSNINSLRGEVNDKMVKKFGMKIDFDEMEEAVLTRLLMIQSKKCDDACEKDKDLRQLKGILENKNEELISLKQQQIEKYNTLIVLQGELNAINEEQKYHEKLRDKYLLAAQNKANEEKDLERLQALLKHQKQQIRKITRDISSMKKRV